MHYQSAKKAVSDSPGLVNFFCPSLAQSAKESDFGKIPEDIHIAELLKEVKGLGVTENDFKGSRS